MDYLTLAGIIGGGLLIAAHILYSRRRNTSTKLHQGIFLFLSGTGFTAGIKVVLFAFDPVVIALLKQEGIENGNIVLGGIAICWASILSTFEIFKQARRVNIRRPRSRSTPQTSSPSGS